MTATLASRKEPTEEVKAYGTACFHAIRFEVISLHPPCVAPGHMTQGHIAVTAGTNGSASLVLGGHECGSSEIAIHQSSDQGSGYMLGGKMNVVIPSLPGFAFSDKPAERGWNAERTARAWSALMQRLGYQRYVAQGGDWGAFVTTAMAQQQSPGLAAIHLNFAQTMPDEIPADLLPDQKRCSRR
jgi:hypothetical protein